LAISRNKFIRWSGFIWCIGLSKTVEAKENDRRSQKKKKLSHIKPVTRCRNKPASFMLQAIFDC